MSDLDDRSGGRRKGLFRRTRADEFTPEAPWEPGQWDQSAEEPPMEGTVPSSVGKRRTSADMFAQRDKGWTESWGDDAWDDEWRDPAFRRVSIPAAANPGPAEVDAWLQDDAQGWSDSTRETAHRWGGSDGNVAQPGTNWDEEPTGPRPEGVGRSGEHRSAAAERNPSVTAVAESLTAPAARLTSSIVARPQVVQAVSDDPVERALATVEHQSIDLTDQPDGWPNDRLDVTEEPVPEATSAPGLQELERNAGVEVDEAVQSAARFDPKPAPLPQPRSRFRRTRSSEVPQTQTAEGLDDGEGQVSLVVPDHGVSPMPPTDTWEDATGPIVTGEAGELGDSTDSAMTEPAQDHSIEAVLDEAPSDAVAVESVPDAGSWEAAADPSSAEQPSGDQQRRTNRKEVAFSDRATWIGAGVAILASLNLVLKVASGMRAADPRGSSLSIFTRIGRGMADLGITQGALLVLAVVLISLPSLIDSRGAQRYDGRVATGLGLTLGGAVVGIFGALLAWSAQRHMATLAGTSGGATNLRLLAEMAVTAGLCLVAFAAALRALRSIHD